jgi:hypothetical protein
MSAFKRLATQHPVSFALLISLMVLLLYVAAAILAEIGSADIPRRHRRHAATLLSPGTVVPYHPKNLTFPGFLGIVLQHANANHLHVLREDEYGCLGGAYESCLLPLAIATVLPL